jgi:aconitate hydratase 2/2-methylisocitrate dehydratase
MSNFFDEYNKHVQERAKEGIPPLALTKDQAEEVVKLLQKIPSGKGEFLLDLLINRINPGVDPAAQVKADFLVGIIKGAYKCDLIKSEDAIKYLGTMIGGYNLQGLVDVVASKDAKLAPLAAAELKQMVLAANVFDDVLKLSKEGNTFAKDIVESWANAEWFTSKPAVPTSIKTVVYKVNGEINTDDFSPAPFAFTRDDIPLHANVMGGSLFPNGPKEIADLKTKYKLPVTFVGDVVGTGSSRKSATNSVLWHIGEDIPFVPNKRRGGVVIGSTVAPNLF